MERGLAVVEEARRFVGLRCLKSLLEGIQTPSVFKRNLQIAESQLRDTLNGSAHPQNTIGIMAGGRFSDCPSRHRWGGTICCKAWTGLDSACRLLTKTFA